jgi:hypothetical protein
VNIQAEVQFHPEILLLIFYHVSVSISCVIEKILNSIAVWNSKTSGIFSGFLRLFLAGVTFHIRCIKNRGCKVIHRKSTGAQDSLTVNPLGQLMSLVLQ